MTMDVAAKQTDARVTVSLEDDQATSAPPAVNEAAQTVPAAAPPPNGPPALEQPPAAAGSGQRTAALVVLGAGVAGLAVGSAFGLVALSKNNEALKPENCRTSSVCTPTGLSLTNDAKNAATVSTIAFAVGGAAAAAGSILWLTSPRATPAVRVTAAASGQYAGATVFGAW